jgi:hypothetical protein
MWVGELANLDAMSPNLNMLDTVDTDKLARGLGFARGVPAHYMRDEAEVQAIREQRAQAMEEQRQMEMLQQASKAASDLGATSEETVQ